MNCCMMFPDSVDEFMEEYKMVDTEHIYSNGTEYVPIFRMKQWFEHLPSAEKTGKWIVTEKGLLVTIYECSECKRHVIDDTGYDVTKDYPFCHCGADMRGDDNV